MWSILMVVALWGATLQACMAWGIYEVFLAEIFERRPFTSEDWKKLARDTSDEGRRMRQFMAEDLLKKRDLTGLSQTAIIDLLGPGDPDAYFSSNRRPSVFSYRLRDPAFVDQNYLVIRFDGDDFVVNASICSN
jgi:hypothetical protein